MMLPAMNRLKLITLLGISLLTGSQALHAEVKTVIERNEDNATSGFKFRNVPTPAKNDAATKATFVLLDGERDANGGDLDILHNGRASRNEDQPAENFFFRAGTDGGRILVDLGSAIAIKQVNTYSWHPGTRGPQVYTLHASDGTADGFNARPKKETDPATCGWKKIASVDTRPKEGDGGGQYGVSIADSEGVIGQYRYLLFAISHTESRDGFGNTFYSEIDVIDPNTPPVADTAPTQPSTYAFKSAGGAYQFTIDTTAAPDLADWAKAELAPVVKDWYPKLVAMLPSEGFTAPTNVTLLFRDDMGGTPASAGGSRINCNIGWFQKNLKGEARGSVVHEMVHVVQQYGRARRNNPNATRTPGWLVEGIPDYIRWFIYEPQSKGAEITQRNLSRAKYDGNYRISANFLNWVSETYDKALVVKLNTAAREGKYTEELWKQYAGKTVQELGDEWRALHEKRLAAETGEKKPGN